MDICIYCGEPRADKIGCCGENHFEEKESDEILLDIPEFLRNQENLKREKEMKISMFLDRDYEDIEHEFFGSSAINCLSIK